MMKRISFLILLLASLCGTTLRAADDILLWGYTPADYAALQANGFNQQNMFGAAVLLTVDDMFDGASITGIDVPFNTEEAWEVTAFVASADDINTPLVSTFNDDGSSVGYNTYLFKEPYRLEKGKNVYVGYTFRIISTATQEERAPILTGGEAMPGGLMIYNKKEWSDYSGAGWGNSGLQVRLKDLVLPSDNATMGKVYDFSGAINATATFQALIRSNSANAISKIGYSVTLGDQTSEGTADVNIPAGSSQTASVTLTVPTLPSVGQYPASVTLTSVNGKPVSPTTAAATATLYTRIVPRYTVMEEKTGTGCMHCTRGWAGMEYMRNHYDRFIAISAHNYNDDDAMVNKNYPDIGLSGAPSCALDRRTGPIDPLYGSDTNALIIADFEACNAIVPEVEVRATGALQGDGTTVAVKVNVDFLYDSPGYSVFYALTADGLTCPADADAKTQRRWMQANIFAQAETREHFRRDGSNELRNFYAEFAKGGEYGSTELYGLVFNDVMIGSSQTTADGQPTTDALPAEGKAGTSGETSRNVTITCSDVCRDALQYDKIYVVALVLDAQGRIANAGKSRVEVPEGIGSVLRQQTTDNRQRTTDKGQGTTPYDLQGRKLQSQLAGHSLFINDGKKIIK